jgi:hypothetical protein
LTGTIQAGQSLVFQIGIPAIRDAGPQEIAAGKALHRTLRRASGHCITATRVMDDS